jgi:hypothetical protein
MAADDDARYAELLVALQLGEAPGWVSASERERFLLASDGHRLALSSNLGARFPRAHFYAAAHFGPAYLEGVGRALVGLAPSGAAVAAKVAEAAKAWSAAARPDVAALFAYDDLVAAPDERPYGGSDRDALRAASGLPERFALCDVACDVLGFAPLLDRLLARFATPEIVARYRPAARRQRLVAYRDGDRVRVREIGPP